MHTLILTDEEKEQLIQMLAEKAEYERRWIGDNSWLMGTEIKKITEQKITFCEAMQKKIEAS